jgi:aarF domain-containing kinase
VEFSRVINLHEVREWVLGLILDPCSLILAMTLFLLFVECLMTGLMTQITNNQKYGMIEAISHLIHRDYEAIVKDFVLLDFIPDGVNLKPIMPVLAKVFDQALEGGGAKNINFQELAGDLAQITFDYPFRIPPYFALIIRAIGVLEGIALVGNPDFAIVDEAYPYIAQV